MMESPPPPHPILYLPGLPDYGFYSAPSDQRGGPCSFADYGSLGPQAAQMLHSEHATSACNSPLQHLHSPDQFKNPGLYLHISSYLFGLLRLTHISNPFFHFNISPPPLLFKNNNNSLKNTTRFDCQTALHVFFFFFISVIADSVTLCSSPLPAH